MYKLLILLYLTNVESVKRFGDVCSYHSRRFYLELGESGVLTAYNLTTVHALRQHHNGSMYNTTFSHEQCTVEVVTCPSCVVSIIFRHMDLGHHCSSGNLLMDTPCRCDYVWISEPPYEDVSGTPYCGMYHSSSIHGGVTYRSHTRTLSISLFYSEPHRHAFTLEYSSERNREYIVGTPGTIFSMINMTNGGVIKSPFFPTLYPRDYGTEFVISCANNSISQNLLSADVCRVRLVFSDFQIASVSVMEFYDSNNQRMEVSTGLIFRPPVILSSGPSLMVRFYANGGSALGFKGSYSFISGSYVEKIVKPITDCGGYVENFGGAITMMNMVERGVKTYDCVWLIRPPKNFLHVKTHLYLKIAKFLDFAGSAEVQIRQGLTSDRPLLETLHHPASQFYHKRPREHIVPVTSGFYVSLRGTFGPTSNFALVYTCFSYMNCFAGTEFLCQNHRCIPAKLSCDNFDHCGDGSDEPASCYAEWGAEPVDRRWYSHTPNYYFPKMERYPDLKTATLVFVITSLGLIFLISALIIILYRVGARARHQRDLQNRLQTISELLDSARIEEMVTPDEPPVYEPPPDYDDVIKSLSNTRRKRRKRNHDSRRSLSSPAIRDNTSDISQPSRLEVRLPDETRHSTRHSRRSSVGSSFSATSGFLSLPGSSNQCQGTQESSITPLPESPPPPYAKKDTLCLTQPESTNEQLPSKQRTSWEIFSDDVTSILSNFAPHRQRNSTVENTTDDGTGNRGFSGLLDDKLKINFDLLGKRRARSKSCTDESDNKTKISESRSNPLTTSSSPTPSFKDYLQVKTRRDFPDECINNDNMMSQLDTAIKNELEHLISSCSGTRNNYNVFSSPSNSACMTEPETHCFSSLESTHDVFISSESHCNNELNFNTCEIDPDKYWEEFDKQFQNYRRPSVDTEEVFTAPKVADLSRKFDNLSRSNTEDSISKKQLKMTYLDKRNGSFRKQKKRADGFRKSKSLSLDGTPHFDTEDLSEFKKNENGLKVDDSVFVFETSDSTAEYVTDFTS